MRAWRICRPDHADPPLGGEGARLFGGRWNPRGVAVAYTSSSLALAALEVFVHVDAEESPSDLVAIEIVRPADILIDVLTVTDLPPDWRVYPAPAELQQIGVDWLRSGRSAALCVPSAVLPEEDNILINPAHPDFGRIIVHPPRPFSFDPRLWKTRR